MNVSFRQLRAFVTVAESGSFSRASSKLFLTQSALSGLIKDLEQSIDVKLFDRTTRQVNLSTMGEHLLPQAKRVLNELTLFETQAQELTSLEQGQIRMAVSQQFAASAMPIIIAEFCQKYPHIHIQLVDCSVESVLKHLQDNAVDLGIGAERRYEQHIHAELLFELPFFVVVPPMHPLAQQSQVAWSALEHEPLITLTGPFTQKLYADLPQTLAKPILKPQYEVNLLSTALGMTAKNLGITLCLPYAKDWVQQQNLQMRLLVEPVITRRFLLYRQKNRALSPAMQTFVNFLLDYPTSELWGVLP
ncbi:MULTISPECIES: LysR family transcriptional regulator [unclassified Moraxella]|uniref:LysR family transcriptional regulator n=1 Tax=unclassified Moraxella TaxID=2685852 RepID=UPI003AF986E4